MEKKQVGLLLIATNKYKQFVQPLIDGIDENFLKEHKINVFLFTDEITKYTSKRVNVIQVQIPPYKFPQATLYRYKIFDEHKDLLKSMDQLFYLDVDMAIVSEVGEEILGEGLTATVHPGFYNGGWGSPNVDSNSKAFVGLSFRKKYHAGGFQGGETKSYLQAVKELSNNIKEDELSGIIAEWHDESHWNKYLMLRTEDFISLNPSYCMVEDVVRRKLWGIDHLEPKILALNKNHAEIRA